MVRLDFTARPPKRADLLQKYGVRGLPTILFLDPEGKVVGQLGTRDPNGVAREFAALADKYRPRFPWEASLEAALEAGRKDGRPLAILFTDGSKEAQATEAAFDDEPVRGLAARIAAVRHAIAKDCTICEAYKAAPGGRVVVVDPKSEDPAAAPLASLAGIQTCTTLAAGLKAALEKRKAAAAPAATPENGDASVEKECRMALMLARNFINQKAFDKAEEQIRKVLEKAPEGKLADQAKALQREIDAAK